MQDLANETIQERARIQKLAFSLAILLKYEISVRNFWQRWPLYQDVFARPKAWATSLVPGPSFEEAAMLQNSAYTCEKED